MAKDTGTVVTMDLNVRVQYTCSRCGKENDLSDTLRVTGTADSILALRRAGAHRDLTALLPRGLSGAQLSCRCACSHRECWASMDYRRLSAIQKYLFILLAASAVGLYLLHTVSQGFAAALLALCALSALGWGGIALYKTLHTRKEEGKIPLLPPESLPRLRLK